MIPVVVDLEEILNNQKRFPSSKIDEEPSAILAINLSGLQS